MTGLSTRRVAARLIGLALGAVALANCGPADSGQGSASAAGVVSVGAPLSGTVSLEDSSVPPKQKTAAVDQSGTFDIDVRGLTPPFLLKADANTSTGPVRMYAASAWGGLANINPLTDVAVAMAAGGDSADSAYARGDAITLRRIAGNFEGSIGDLRSVLKPLFDEYAVPADLTVESAGRTLQAMFHDIRFAVSGGNLVVTNIETGTVIFTGPLSNLGSGTFTSTNMPHPTSPSGTTAPGVCSYTYSAWGACQPDGTSSRSVISTSPPGCTGTPSLVGSCQGGTPPPPSCSYTYAAWGACQPDGTQTRTVASAAPAGCYGNPVVLQACTYVPPCTYAYSDWSTCQPDGTQSRTVASSSPAGCTGTPVLTQSCGYTPPACTYAYSDWGACQPDGTQSRSVTSTSPSGCTGTPSLTQSCAYTPPACSYSYSAWGDCQPDGTQTRSVTSSSPSGCNGTPSLTQSCTYTPPACTYSYSDWGACQPDGTQTRTVVSSSPDGCAGTPDLNQSCTYAGP